MAPPEILLLVREGDPPLGLETSDPDPGEANDSGFLFRFSDDQWVYNLSTRDLSAGSYRLVIGFPDGRRFNADFALR